MSLLCVRVPSNSTRQITHLASREESQAAWASRKWAQFNGYQSTKRYTDEEAYKGLYIMDKTSPSLHL
ncbi:hypothetical protein J4Q44_G00160010 [Coregonus suidteri]|uniref:Uncharacterized protein n=1 Tax=Coregonus suidteri TaxID=861788 RepID=A0AAN8LMZ3_9TELE